MASAFGHALTAVAIGSAYPRNMVSWRFWVLGMICSILPDADVISFAFGVPYEAFWGHRGFTHSFLFALITGLVVTFIFFRKKTTTAQKIGFALFFSLCTASHSVWDALTNGGLGVGFFLPWDATRYFFPWRPIQVSPIGIDNFFSAWGMRVILSELVWIGVPCLVFIVLSGIMRKIRAASTARKS